MMFLDNNKRYNFIGIGGIGMSSLARILNARKFNIAGSDKNANTPLVLDMIKEGITVYNDHSETNVRENDVIIISDAIKENNPELSRAKELNIPIYKRADLLAYFVNNSKGIAVSGTHGKTTTSGMISQISLLANLDPTCVLGGELKTIGSNFKNGNSDLVIAEACEAYNSFLDLEPYIGIVNNIEVDHLDFHKTPENLYNSFAKFMSRSIISVVNGDDKNAKRLIPYANRPFTFGFKEDSDFVIKIADNGTFNITNRKTQEHYDDLQTQQPGLYNIYNAAAAATTSILLKIDVDYIRRGLKEFPGMARRFETIGKYRGADVIDDYAHHPTEISSLILGAKERCGGRIIAVFQPHLFSRTKDFLDGFAESLKEIDILYLAPIYYARELPIEGVSHFLIAERIGKPKSEVICLESLEDGIQKISELDIKEKDLIVTIGAGDVNRIAYALTRE